MIDDQRKQCKWWPVYCWAAKERPEPYTTQHCSAAAYKNTTTGIWFTVAIWWHIRLLSWTLHNIGRCPSAAPFIGCKEQKYCTSYEQSHVLFNSKSSLNLRKDSQLELILREKGQDFILIKPEKKMNGLHLPCTCGEAFWWMDDRSSIFLTVSHLPEIITVMTSSPPPMCVFYSGTYFFLWTKMHVHTGPILLWSF